MAEQNVITAPNPKANSLKKTTIEFDREIYLRMKIRIAHLDMNMKNYIEGLIAADTGGV
ncbi:MAG: hypothetical protein P8M34_07820 [Saprospiraceae bacterium]|nr:hypothetical protein [Saprospiraceae bacterium]